MDNDTNNVSDNRISAFEQRFISLICFIFIGIFIGKIIEYVNRERVLNINNYEEYISVDFNRDAISKKLILKITTEREIQNLQITIHYSLSSHYQETREYDFTYSFELIEKEEPIEYSFDSPKTAFFVDQYEVVSISGVMD